MRRVGAVLGGLFALLGPAYAEFVVCAGCHPRETARFLATPMGRSIGAPDAIAQGGIFHAPSKSSLTASYRNGQLSHAISKQGLTAEYRIAFQIGRGVRARTYAARVGDYLLESPLSWYKGSGWDVSPGYEDLQLLDFDRPVTENCLFCHAGQARADDADGRRIRAAAVSAITCERCHGASDQHVRRPSAKNIVNPAKLTGSARDSVCEQCHLEGETRIANPGKTHWDYRPGQPLEDTLATYFLKGSGGVGRKAVTQVEELAESKCASLSAGKLWCGSCHNPHGEVHVTEVCTGCHASLSKTAHITRAAQCTGCHMPARPGGNVAHIAVTDHRLRLPNAPDAPSPPGPARITTWREPPAQFRLRNLALAGLHIAAEEQLPALAGQSTKLLEALPVAQQNNDTDVLSALEVLFLGSSSPEKAVSLSRWAVDAAPQSATFALNYGMALMRAGNLPEAEREFLRAIDLDPSLMQAAAQLAVLYDREGRKADSKKALERFLQWNPQSIQFRSMGRGPATQQ